MKRTLRSIYQQDVLSPKGKRKGRVQAVLFDSARPRVVGYQVERPRLLYLIERRPVFLAADRVEGAAESLTVSQANDAWGERAAKRLGIDWEQTVIWLGMPVATRGGDRLGIVRDARFDVHTRQVLSLVIGGGVASDVAVGVREVSGDLLIGFRDGVVTVADEVARIETDGGAAAAAGRGVAVASAHVSGTAKATVEVAKAAADLGVAAVQAAARSRTARKATGMLKAFGRRVSDAMKDADD